MFTCEFLIFFLLGPAGLTVDDHDPMEDKVCYTTLYYQLHIFIIVQRGTNPADS